MSGSDCKPSLMSGIGREAVTDVWEWSGVSSVSLGVVGGHHGCPGVDERPSRMSGSGRKSLSDV